MTAELKKFKEKAPENFFNCQQLVEQARLSVKQAGNYSQGSELEARLDSILEDLGQLAYEIRLVEV